MPVIAAPAIPPSDVLSAAAKRSGQTLAAPFRFELPRELEASGPPESRGVRRDQVRLLVLDRRSGAVTHTRFDRIGEYLRPGDLLVANNSRTLPALMRGELETGVQAEVRLARCIDAESWEALLLPHGGEHSGRTIRFAGELRATVLGRREDVPWLWRLRFNARETALLDAIYRAGEPVRYDYVPLALPIDCYQTVYAAEPGSVEMPSAGRPFSWQLLLDLRRRGIETAFLTLHTGLSSARDDGFDALRIGHEERFQIDDATAAAVNTNRKRGGRVIAVGTTVVRALESVADDRGVVHPANGTTDLYISSSHRLRAVDGLLTGLHEPQASHLDLLTAFVPPALLAPAYNEALRAGYLWHEFGDENLIL